MIYELPLPISTNALFFNLPKGGRAKTERYKKWLHEAGLMLICQRARPMPGQVQLEIIINEKSKCDPDNALKCVFDALVSRGILEDDSPKFVRRFTFERSDKIEGVRVTIKPVGKE